MSKGANDEPLAVRCGCIVRLTSLDRVLAKAPPKMPPARTTVAVQPGPRTDCRSWCIRCTPSRKEAAMPMYLMLTKLTPEGRRTLHTNPKRLEEVNQEIEAFGCQVREQYALLGQYDFVSIIEAADNSTVAHLSVDLGSRGTVDIVTMPAIPRAELYEKLTGDQQLGHA